MMYTMTHGSEVRSNFFTILRYDFPLRGVGGADVGSDIEFNPGR